MANYIGNKPAERYTINGQLPDADGNFTIDTLGLNIADTDHGHTVSDIVGLQAELDSKSSIGHEHSYVKSFTVNDDQVTGDVKFIAAGDLSISQVGDQITMTQLAPTVAATDTITDVNDSSSIKTFVGTQAEWDTYKTTITDSSKYLVYIHS